MIQGNWSGSYSLTTTNDVGTSAIQVAQDGSFTGNGHDTSDNYDFSIVGTIKADGTVQYNLSGGITATGSGKWSIDSRGHLVGPITNVFSNGTASANYDLTKSPS